MNCTTSFALRAFGAVAALCAAATAQIPQLLPYPRTLDLLVVDSSADGVWRLADRNQDGDYNDSGEVTRFYDDTIGSIPLTNPDCVVWSPTGVAYVGDSTVDKIVSLIDRNGDGDANDPGEHSVYFDSNNNAGNITMASVQGITSDADGVLYLAVANSGGGGKDVILRLVDTNQDGDANDRGEASEYCVIPNSSSSVANSIPTELLIGTDGRVYYTDVSANGTFRKGVYRLDDLNRDGDCNDAGEHALYWAPTVPGNAFFWGMAIGFDGTFYVTDHGNEQIYAGRDRNNDNFISAAEERVWHKTAKATWWDICRHQDGAWIVCEDQTPDRLLQFRDLNRDGDVDDPGERVEIYSDLVSPVAIRPRAAAFMRGPMLEIQPATVKIGNPTAFKITTPKQTEPVAMYFAAFQATTPIPPIGVLRLNQATLTPIFAAVSNASAEVALNFSVPNNPTLVGAWPFQVLAGDAFRPYLSNVAVLTITR